MTPEALQRALNAERMIRVLLALIARLITRLDVDEAIGPQAAIATNEARRHLTAWTDDKGQVLEDRIEVDWMTLHAPRRFSPAKESQGMDRP